MPTLPTVSGQCSEFGLLKKGNVYVLILTILSHLVESICLYQKSAMEATKMRKLQ